MWNYRVATVWDIPIRVNVSLLVFLPVLAWLIGSGDQITLYAGIINGFAADTLQVSVLRSGNTPWLIGVLAAVGLFASVTVHELGHAWAARRYGVETESITLWILGGLASFKAIPREWHKEFWIAIAGPIASVGVAAVAYVAVLAVPSSLPVAAFVLGWLVVANVTLTVFNLLPAFPMDGGRILRALLARSRPYASATRTAARIGSGFALGFAVLGILSFSPLLLLLALFVYGAANSESRLVALDSLLDGVTVRDVMTTDVESVSADTPVPDFLNRMMEERRTTYLVTDGTGPVSGVVSLDDTKRARGRDGATVGDIAATDLPRVSADDPLFEAIGTMNRARANALLVQENGRIVGMLTATELSSAIRIRREAGSAVNPRIAM
ncbi:site-2 protease family protein [Halorussus salinisoli]|uniref:site-2 protease family protein n=1 Tax=Halorussus salinisoli TaxID=2558242 RepID=UPI0010C219A5|nr:site-2 protease family protein [Halorussus salinisoli]